jgi:hypothetical protein
MVTASNFCRTIEMNICHKICVGNTHSAIEHSSYKPPSVSSEILICHRRFKEVAWMDTSQDDYEFQIIREDFVNIPKLHFFQVMFSRFYNSFRDLNLKKIWHQNCYLL